MKKFHLNHFVRNSLLYKFVINYFHVIIEMWGENHKKLQLGSFIPPSIKFQEVERRKLLVYYSGGHPPNNSPQMKKFFEFFMVYFCDQFCLSHYF